ncbi:MAG: MFS transporter [Solirubrobacterales bacterium]|nr:MFS transporter [Solirubrobacterales bacterium]
MLGLLRRFALDLTPVRRARHFRLLLIGEVISQLGTQAALVALPYQIYTVSHSAALVGLLGVFELVPMIAVSLVGGAFLDRHDRRPILILAQLGLIGFLGALVALTLLFHHPPVLAVLALGGLIAGCGSLDQVARNAITPALLGPELLRAGLALAYALQQAASIIGPGLGGLAIGAVGVSGVYIADAVSCVAVLLAACALPAQPPALGSAAEEHPPVRTAIADGLSFVRRTRALAASFLIDINAMTFGMPRALFAVLSLTVYHAGASGTGALYAAIAVGGTVSVLTSAWVGHIRRVGWMVIICVLVWGLTILGAGVVRSLWPAAVLLAAAGWADGISAVGRQTIAQTLTPEHMRGRMSAIYSVVVAGGPRLGDLESGLVAGAVGALNSVLVGGAACVLGVGAVMLVYPELAGYDADAAMTVVAESSTA